MRHNPLAAPILHILKQATACLSEYELIRQLESQGPLIEVMTDNYQLALFRKHFLVMNALYQLQTELLAERIYLHISALQIALHGSNGQLPDGELSAQGTQKMRDYYLDWRNYQETGEAEVQRLLSGFWQRYAAHDKRQPALCILGLDADADWLAIRNSYRRLAQQHHPDKGGSEHKFLEVREAYEILRCCFDAT